MKPNEYQYLACRTCMPFDSTKDALTYASLGLSGESGEVAEIIKKWVYHGHPFDKRVLRDELGDVAWYLAITAHKAGLLLDEVLEYNIKKLEGRYPNGWDSEKSRNRDG